MENLVKIGLFWVIKQLAKIVATFIVVRIGIPSIVQAEKEMRFVSIYIYTLYFFSVPTSVKV